MAARWGAGEETLTACNMDFFPMDTLDETAALSSDDSLEALQSCLDPSILSIFEDTPHTETKGLDEESEATLLTALTEILDNVDDENLSPFDTLPDSDLLSGQKGREHSPLRRLLCLSRSPPEKDTLSSARPSLTGKNLPRMQADSLQRSDGEEEEDGSSFTLSPVGHDSSAENNLLDWEGLTLPLPVTFEQEDDSGVSVSLGDLVRHMHPYCMAISVENEEGEQMLPEGGILLEVVDQGENGEPILAIPDMDLPISLPHNEQKHSDDRENVASDSSEHIVVDDDDNDEDVTLSAAPLKVSAPSTPLDTKDEVNIQRQKDEMKEKSPNQRKKRKKSKEQCLPKPVEGTALRSGTVRKQVKESPKKPERKSVKDEKKQKISTVSPVSALSSSGVKIKKADPCQNTTQTEITTRAQLPETNGKVTSRVSPKQETAPLKGVSNDSQYSCSLTLVSSQQPDETANHPAPEKLEDSSVAPLDVLPPVSSESATAVPSPVTPPVSEDFPHVASTVPEPKPKSLSLAEYRRLRQQKKPAPMENQDAGNSSKWPSLPELPKELPPIPCLPNPGPKDPRRPISQTAKKEVEEVRPAWQPRGRCAPPTPEALLVPPAYMVSSSSKVSAASTVPKPQQTREPSKPSVPQTPAPSSEKNSTIQRTCTHPVPYASQGCDSTASSKPETPLLTSAGGKCSPALSHVNSGCSKSVEPPTTCSKTTTEAVKQIAAPISAPSASQKNAAVFTKVPEVKASTLVDELVSSDGKFPKDNDTRVASATHPSDSKSLKMEPDMTETKGKPTTEVKSERAKSPTQELIEAFTSEIGIEAADLTSLLEQFEETQAKEEKCVAEVSGRAAAVGNSSVDLAPEKTVVERVRANDLTSTAALTPPATPPHQMWKPLAPVALLGKSKAAEASKSGPSKIIQIEAKPLPSFRSRSKPTPTAATVTPEVACMDHDYCLPSKGTGDVGMRWNIKQQSSITIKPIKPNTTTTQTPSAAPTMSAGSTTKATFTTKAQEVPLMELLDHRIHGVESSSVLETPDASPARQEDVKEQSPKQGSIGRSYRQRAASRSPSPRSSPKEGNRGRSRKRRSYRSPSPMSSSSDTHSSRSRSRSHSPAKKRYRPCRSRSRSSSSSCSSYRSSSSMSRSPPRRRRYSYSSSRSGSWSRSRSRSPSPERSQWHTSRRLYRPSCRPSYGQSANINMEMVKKSKEKAIEERRVVYVGRIHGTMTQKELKERFSLFGEIEDCTLHFRDHGDNYGFVTYYDTKDAFTAIENGSKLRKSDELPFDLCFGGRRQFCQTSYADLDSSREYDPTPARSKLNALDFDTLLRQAQQKIKR